VQVLVQVVETGAGVGWKWRWVEVVLCRLRRCLHILQNESLKKII
jgi:hypothetical protein